MNQGPLPLPSPALPTPPGLETVRFTKSALKKMVCHKCKKDQFVQAWELYLSPGLANSTGQDIFIPEQKGFVCKKCRTPFDENKVPDVRGDITNLKDEEPNKEPEKEPEKEPFGPDGPFRGKIIMDNGEGG